MKKRTLLLTALLLTAISGYSWATEVQQAKPETVGMSSVKLDKVKTESAARTLDRAALV